MTISFTVTWHESFKGNSATQARFKISVCTLTLGIDPISTKLCKYRRQAQSSYFKQLICCSCIDLMANEVKAEFKSSETHIHTAHVYKWWTEQLLSYLAMLFNNNDYTVSNARLSLDDELRKIWNKSIRGILYPLHFLKWLKKNHENPQWL